MPIAGTGMLMTSMDIDAEHEREFNQWYDREHLAERVAIPGFVEARRYVAVDAAPKYLGLYSTENFDVLDSDAYRTALGNQTAWYTDGRITVAICVMGLLLFYRHRENIVRLMAGKESRLGGGKKKV